MQTSEISVLVESTLMLDVVWGPGSTNKAIVCIFKICVVLQNANLKILRDYCQMLNGRQSCFSQSYVTCPFQDPKIRVDISVYTPVSVNPRGGGGGGDPLDTTEFF